MELVPSPLWKLAERKDKKDRELSMRIRGIFNIHNIIDCTTFAWTRYLSYDLDSELDLKEQLTLESESIGLLSALLATITVSLLLGGYDKGYEQSAYATWYVALWLASTIFTLCSTCLAVFQLIACNKSESQVEMKYFVRLFANHTFGIGTMAPLVFFYLGVICLGFGLMLAGFVYYDIYYAFLFMGVLAFSFWLYLIVYMCMVRTLHASRVTAKFLNNSRKEISVGTDDIKMLLKKCEYMYYLYSFLF